jgi:S1-C subfamily serine protease
MSINPEMGGALVNTNGELIGINSAIVSNWELC